MLISIIVPVYNVENYVESCLMSVARQTYGGDMECIIVNDATLDSSAQIARDFIGGYKGRVNFKLIEHPSNMGLSEARNTGLQNACGEYVLFLDSDDELEVYAVEELVKPLTSHSYDFIVGAYSAVPETDELTCKFVERDVFSKEQIIKEYTSGAWYAMAWNKLCNRRFLLEKNLFFLKGLIHEDELWSLQLANSAERMCLISSSTYKYKLRSNSIMGLINKSSYDRIHKRVNLYKKLEEYILITLPFNVANYSYLESKRNNLLNDIYAQRRIIDIKALYVLLHNKSSYRRFLLNHSHQSGIKAMIRDLHFFMPAYLGYYCWRIYRGIYGRLFER